MVKRVGSAVEPYVVGQDPQRRFEIEEKLFKDFKPKDILEEIWLSDLAVLTAAIEYYRKLEAAVTLKIAKERGLEKNLQEEFYGKKGHTMDDAIGSSSLRKALGEFTPEDLKQITAIVDLIAKTRRERERVYLLFERKRRPLLLNAMRVAQGDGRESYAIENLGD